MSKERKTDWKKTGFVVIICFLIFIFGQPISSAADFDAEVQDVWLYPSGINQGDSSDVKIKVKNLADPDNGYNGYGTYDIRLRIWKPSGSHNGYYWDDYELSYHEVKIFKKSSYLFDESGTYTIKGEVYDINGFENGWTTSHRLDYRTEYFDVTEIQHDPVASRDSPSSSSIHIAKGSSQTFRAYVTDTDCDLNYVEWYLEGDPSPKKIDNSVSGCSDTSSWTHTFSTYETSLEVTAIVFDSRNDGAHVGSCTWSVDVGYDPTASRNSPSQGSITLTQGQSQTFIASVNDADCDLNYVEWYLEGDSNPKKIDNSVSGCSATSSWSNTFSNTGTFEVKAIVFDDQNSGSHVGVATWSVTVNPIDTINFSGYTWNVRPSGESRKGPGNNYWSNSTENVWKDADGQLHLKITYRNEKWYCSEIYSQETFGYGSYYFFASSRVDGLDKNVVVGLFTYLDDNNEIDIEFSKWGEDNADNSQYVVQPYYHAGNTHRFNMQLNGDYSTHCINWHQNYINFFSLHGHYYTPPDSGHIIDEWEYTGGDIPATSTEKVHLNLWLVGGNPPSDGQSAEMIIKKFEFVPVSKTPKVTTNSASNIGTSFATLNGNLDDTGGESCQVWFEYGKTTSYGSSTSPETKASPSAFDAVISNLDDDRIYHFRAVAENSPGIDYGDDETFKTGEEYKLEKWSYEDYLPTALDKIFGIIGRDVNVHGRFEAVLEPIDNVKQAEVELELGYIPIKEFGSSYDPLDLGNPNIVWETKTFEMKRVDRSFIAEPKVITWWAGNLLANLGTLLMGPKSWVQYPAQSMFLPEIKTYITGEEPIYVYGKITKIKCIDTKDNYSEFPIDRQIPTLYQKVHNAWLEQQLQLQKYQIVSVMCPVNTTITDQYGRVISDNGINEIPDANMTTTNETKIFYLPTTIAYSAEIDAYDTGKFNFTRFSPIEGDILITKFENISITSSTIAFVEVEQDVTNYTMSIDYNGDGEIDEEKNRDVNETIEVKRPPIASFTYSPENPVVNQAITFNASNSTDTDGNIISYEWGFGDETNGTGEITTHFYSLAGDYNAILTITDNEEVKNSIFKVITVSELEEIIFDTDSPYNSYPSICGNHTGTITPNKTITVNKLYTYPCAGTGGHTEYARIWNSTLDVNAIWNGYTGDWHNISFDNTFTLVANETYNYTIRTGSYPQIYHTHALPTENGWINCTQFIDANGKSSANWIPAIKLF